MRLTLDANILVRANVRAAGPARALFGLIRSDPSHILVLSRHLLSEVKQSLLYPRLQALYGLTETDVQEHVDLLQRVSEIVEPTVSEPVIRSDPKDDPVLYTAVDGRADVLCTRDRDFYAPEVVAFCRQRGIEVMNEIELLRLLERQQAADPSRESS
jgi:putative PIN family toxin of toxin-antitoxin system